MESVLVSELQQQLLAKDHHIKLLAKTLGECIELAGITCAGAALTGPELLVFGDDLKRHLETHAPGKFMPEGAERCDECDTITARMDGDGCAKWCCCCGAKLNGNYVTTLAHDVEVSHVVPADAVPDTSASSEPPVARVSVVNIDPWYPSPGRNVYVNWLDGFDAKVIDGTLLFCSPQTTADALTAPSELIKEAARLLHIHAPGGGSAEDLCVAELRELLTVAPVVQQEDDA